MSLSSRYTDSDNLSSNATEYPYVYTGIESKAGTVRILTLLPGQQDEDIRCRLDDAILSKSSKNLTYEALSYTWGSPEDPKRIWVDDKYLFVTRNLADALLHLRLDDNPRILWIDAICVNQQDLKERGAQVPRMCEIYSLATRVVVWLGPETKNCHLALDVLETISSKFETDRDAPGAMVKPILPEDACWADKTWQWPFDQPSLDALASLLFREWFERLWIWQEIRLANKAAANIILVGHHTILWRTFDSAITCLYERGLSGGKTFGSKAAEDRARLIFRILPIAALGGLIQMSTLSSQSKCTDPRDRIYAFLNIVDDHITIKPDYEKTTAEVYQEVTLERMRQIRSLALLRECNFGSNLDGIATWVPDYSLPAELRPVKVVNPDAAADSEPEAKYCGDGVLRCQGVRAKVIDSILDVDMSTYSAEDSVQRLKEVLDRNAESTPYVGGGNMLQAYCHSLFAGEFTEKFYPPPPYLRTVPECENMLRDILAGSESQMADKFVEEASGILKRLCDHTRGRVLVTTTDGFIGLAPKFTRKGDIACAVLGCKGLLIIRPYVELGPIDDIAQPTDDEDTTSSGRLHRYFSTALRPQDSCDQVFHYYGSVPRSVLETVGLPVCAEDMTREEVAIARRYRAQSLDLLQQGNDTIAPISAESSTLVISDMEAKPIDYWLRGSKFQDAEIARLMQNDKNANIISDSAVSNNGTQSQQPVGKEDQDMDKVGLRASRPTVHQVVGECYIHKLMYGELFLGSLPVGWAKVNKFDAGTLSYWTSYYNPETQQYQTGDPRLGPLPAVWYIKSHSEETAWDFVTNAEEEERQAKLVEEARASADSGKISEALLQHSVDPRRMPDAFKARGLKLERIHLV
ncbi:hypothetical protein VTL71DRAFT_2217 [Oculimacula yallundae]|uniref:Heterokaryon incompatibility domain-containing protein n=1 Tax=Oculimacula yallundae TaxID=86028 RepID=A0ABR4C899_9HELO